MEITSGATTGGHAGTRPTLPALNGARPVAAALVVATHLAYAFDVFGRSRPGAHLLLPGPTAVSFFFLVSGFVLMWSCQDRPAIPFWRDRAARMVPLHAVVVVLAAINLVSIGRAIDPRWTLELFLVQAWVPDVEPFASQASPVPASWSLSCELLFYVAAPVAFAWLPRLGHSARRWALVGAVALVVAGGAAGDVGLITHVESYQLPILRLPEFALGGLLALEVAADRAPRVPLAGALAAGAVAWLVVPEVALSYGYAACTVVPWALIIVSLAQLDLRGDRLTVLHHPAAQALGRWTFALYLTHGLVLRLLHRALRSAGIEMATLDPLGMVAVGVPMVVIMVAAAAAMHHLVEQPLNRLVRGSGRRSPAIPAEAAPALSG